MFFPLQLAHKSGQKTCLLGGDSIIFTQYGLGTGVTVVREHSNLLIGYREPSAELIFLGGANNIEACTIVDSILRDAGLQTTLQEGATCRIGINEVPLHLIGP